MPRKKAQLVIIGIIAVVLCSLAVWRYIATAQALDQVKSDFEAKLADMQAQLDQKAKENEDLLKDLEKEEERNDDFERQIEKLSGTIGDLEKLSKTDEELLQKYSKVSFLNEHFVPQRLTKIDKKYVVGGKEAYIHASVNRYFEDMMDDAKDDGVNLLVASAYRSFGTQTTLKAGYKVTYGSGANAFSADQGFSEHQLGTTLDFTNPTLNGGLDGFENTPEYAWLEDNAYRYGFVLSYPPNNTYYVFEPWHWRFVGRDLAKVLHREGKNFYDLDQRDIDKYLLEIFD